MDVAGPLPEGSENGDRGVPLAEVYTRSVSPRLLAGLRSWLADPLRGCTQGAVREAAVVLAELLTNADRHGEPPFRVRVAALRGGHLLRLSVRDGGQAPGTPWVPRGGLLVVRRLCRSWGVTASGEGKSVWAELPLLVPPDLV